MHFPGPAAEKGWFPTNTLLTCNYLGDIVFMSR